MKKHIFTTIAFALFTIGCMHAQYNQEAGPLVKNRKPWKDECELRPIVFVERKSLEGPMAKNVRPERHNCFVDYTK